MYNHLELMNIQAEVLYVHDHVGRITTINEYRGQPAPRFFWGQTDAGRVVRFRKDVPDNVVRDILRILDFDDPTNQLAKVITVLGKDKGIGRLWMGPAYAFHEIKSGYADATLVTEKINSAWNMDFHLCCRN